MSEPAAFRYTGAAQGMRLFGVETEYGFAPLDRNGERLDRARSVTALMHELCALVPHLHCSGPMDVFTVNGSRVYIDCGVHPEVATPECSTPEEAVAFTRAGDRLLAEAARAVERNSSERGIELVLWKANVDHRSGATWGSHESYLHVVPQHVLASQLITHLVTRIVYTGAGGFSNRSHGLRFVVSPRAAHLERETSGDSTRTRGIFHTRDEPLADGECRRLHVLAGESLWSECADYLRVGTTALLVAQIDAGRRPQADLDLAAPLDALATVANDVECTAPLRMERGAPLTAIAIQRCLLESVEADLGAEHLPSWAGAVCARWRDTLDRLETSPASMIGVLDWPTKLAVLKRQCEAQGEPWTFSRSRLSGTRSRRPASTALIDRSTPFAARMLETDMRFNRLDDHGVFAALERDNALSHHVVTNEAIERAVREPPAAGRARIRSAHIEQLCRDIDTVSCTWQEITDHKRNQRLDLGNPFQSEGEQWTRLPVPKPRRAQHTEAGVRPIQQALRAGTPREAMLRMQALLTRTQPPSLLVCRYCISVFDSMIPSVPVPVLARGAATAGAPLQALFEHVRHEANRSLEDRVGTLLYRYYEARGSYQRAAGVIEQLLARATEHGNDSEIARLTNNLGYEHLLAGDWSTAIPLFERAMPLFEQSGRLDELPSIRANLLECKFGERPPERWTALLPELTRVNRALVENQDWRARKSQMLLARLAQARGRRAAAIVWTKRALDAAKGVQTQLREWDQEFLNTVEGAS